MVHNMVRSTPRIGVSWRTLLWRHRHASHVSPTGQRGVVRHAYKPTFLRGRIVHASLERCGAGHERWVR